MHGCDTMLVEHLDPMLLCQVRPELAVLRIGPAILEQFPSETADRLRPAPIDGDQSAAGHAAQPPARLDHENAAPLAGGGDTLLRTNNGWDTASNAAQVSAAAASVGAFPFPAGSPDAAILGTPEQVRLARA
jgi:hypothetical protein